MEKDEFRKIKNYLINEFFRIKVITNILESIIRKRGKEIKGYENFFRILYENLHNNICLSIRKLVDSTNQTLYANIKKLIKDKEIDKQIIEILRHKEINKRRNNYLGHSNYKETLEKYKSFDSPEEEFYNLCKNSIYHNIQLKDIKEITKKAENIRKKILKRLATISKTNIEDINVNKMYGYSFIASSELEKIMKKIKSKN